MIDKTQNFRRKSVAGFPLKFSQTFFGGFKNFSPLEKLFHSLSFEILQFFLTWLNKNCKKYQNVDFAVSGAFQPSCGLPHG